MAAIKKDQKVSAVHPVHGSWQTATAMHDSGKTGSFSDPDRQTVVWLEWEDGYTAQQPLEFIEV